MKVQMPRSSALRISIGRVKNNATKYSPPPADTCLCPSSTASIGRLAHTDNARDSKPRIVKIQAMILVGNFGALELILGG